jgi:hypothetical protein
MALREHALVYTGDVGEYRFHGTESITIELEGTFDPGALVLPPGLEHDGDAGRGRVSLFAFHVEKLRAAGLPLVSFTYPELLWRIAVRRGDERAWWAIACDLHARGPRWAARRYVRYEVRANVVEVAEHRIRSRGPSGELAIGIDNKVEPATLTEPRVLLTGRDAGWRVPWGDGGGTTAPLAHRVAVETDTLSAATLGTAVMWANRATVRRGREHRCGVAHR